LIKTSSNQPESTSNSTTKNKQAQMEIWDFKRNFKIEWNSQNFCREKRAIENRKLSLQMWEQLISREKV
jgi:hypothetical protein